MAIRRRYEGIEENFGLRGWKKELDVFYRQRKSVIFVFALMVFMAAFWTSFWVWTVFFGVMAAYSLLVGVRIGFVCGLSFAIWFLALREWPLWFLKHQTIGQVIGLWCLATLFLLVVWKHDGQAEQLKLPHRSTEEVG